MEAKVLNFIPKQEEHEHTANKTDNGFQNNLELRLGFSAGVKGRSGLSPSARYINFQNEHLEVKRNEQCCAGPKRSLCEVACGFSHQCYLVAPQGHARPKIIPAVLRTTHTTVPVVGWPPIRSFRKNLASPQPSKIDNNLGSDKNEEKKKVAMQESMQDIFPEVKKPVMFVKVNMDGYAVGRKIDIQAHDGYDSLSFSLQKMFHNFLSANCMNNQKQDEKHEVKTPNYVLLYEDNEGDRMLVGDVPWEMFVSSVKRLYITEDSNKVQKSSGATTSKL